MSIKRLMRKIHFTGITLNIGFIGLNFAGGSSKVNIVRKTVLALLQHSLSVIFHLPSRIIFPCMPEHEQQGYIARYRIYRGILHAVET